MQNQDHQDGYHQHLHSPLHFLVAGIQDYRDPEGRFDHRLKHLRTSETYEQVVGEARHQVLAAIAVVVEAAAGCTVPGGPASGAFATCRDYSTEAAADEVRYLGKNLQRTKPKHRLLDLAGRVL